jgi:hypothetical protein
MIKKIITCMFCLMLANGLAAQTSEKVWNFDFGKQDGIPEGFTVVLGDWKIAADSDAPSRPNVKRRPGWRLGLAW